MFSLKKIGAGAMGTVYKSIDTQTNKTVALKHLKSEAMDADEQALARFQREGEVLQQLRHPNIVEVIHTDFEAATPIIVMSYVANGSLADFIAKNGPLPLKTVLKIALEIADALTRAHHLNILHRDLKPGNILLNKDLTPYLCDFGLAHIKGEDRLTKLEYIVGTISYMSPEVLNYEVLDEKTDIWGFGVILYEMLTGVRPFRGDTLINLINGILTEPPQPDLEIIRPDIPIALIDLIYRMLTKDVYARIPRMRLIGAELESILRDDADLSAANLKTAPDVGNDITFRFETPVPTQPIKHNLPNVLMSVVGRETELLALHKLIDQSENRLITILAAGGMGKTRLALEVGQHVEIWEHGVYFVDLAPLTQADEIPTAIARAMDFQFYKGPPQREQILNYLRAKNMLLIMCQAPNL